MPSLNELEPARRLREHAAAARDIHLRNRFAADPARGDRMHLEVAGWYVDYAKPRVDDVVLHDLCALADARGLRGHIDAMFRGDHVNVTEDRPALHVALRMPRASSLVVDGVDVVADVHRVLERMA